VSSGCARIAEQVGVGCPEVVTARGLFSPFLWHPLLRPARIVIPCQLADELSAESLDAILCHELVHLRRRDAWRRHFEAITQALWWWLPTTWIARQRLHELEELCTDAAVLRAIPQGARAYARALLDTDEFLSGATPHDLDVVPALTRGDALTARITRIVGGEPCPMSRRSHLCLTGLVGALLCLGLVTAGFVPSVDRRASAQSVAGPAAPQRAVGATESIAAELSPVGPAIMPETEWAAVHRSGTTTTLLTWSSGEATPLCRMVRLMRLTPDGVEPRLWLIDRQWNDACGEIPVTGQDLPWILAFLGIHDSILDCDAA
jgi:hypothetical protein